MMPAFVLPQVIKTLREQWPKISIEVIASSESSDLSRREVDVAIRNYRSVHQELIAKRVNILKAIYMRQETI